MCDLVLGQVPGSHVVTDVGAELSFLLPSSATQYFPPLFDKLEGPNAKKVHYLYMYMIDGRTDRQTDRQTDKQTDRQTDGWTGRRRTNRRTDRQTGRHMDRPTDRKTDGQTDRHTHRHTDTQIDRETDRQTDERTDGQMDRQMDVHGAMYFLGKVLLHRIVFLVSKIYQFIMQRSVYSTYTCI